MEIEHSSKPARPIRLLLVVRWPVGGIRTFMRYVYSHFSAEYYSFVLIAPDQAETHVLLQDLAGLDITYYPVSENPGSFELARAVFRQLVTGSIDLVHSQGFTSGICSSLPATFTRTPHLLTVHETLNDNQFSGYSGFFKRVGMEIALSLINEVQSVSHDAQANLLEFFPLLRERCLVIPNGIEVGRFQQADPRNLHKELLVDNDCFLIGFFGRFMKPKGFVYLVDAVAQLLQSQTLHKNFLVVAFGEGGFIREEKAALHERGLDEYFRFLPFTPNVAGVVKGLNLVAMPSLWEACPLLPMEVLTCGTPLVASNCIGLREVVQDTPAIVVQAGDGNSLAEGIRFCIEHDLRQKFIEYAPIAAKRYDVTTTVEQLYDLLNSMV